jgi:uncharacterized protein YciI
MKNISKLTSLLLTLTIGFTNCGDHSASKDHPADSLTDSVKAQAQNKPGYNKALADSLGADEYGMKSYVLVILKTGETKMDDGAKKDSLFAGHMANIGRLSKEGKLVVAGPIDENDKAYRGIFILNVATIEEATVLLATDPTIKAGILAPELYKWYGSAALPLYLKHHDVIQKESF